MRGRRWHRLSLERKLPLLIFVVLLGLMVTGAALAYREVRQYALSAATERLESATHQISDLLAPTLAERLAAGRVAAEAPAVQRMLAAGTPDSATRAAAARALDELRPAGTPTDVLELRDGRGEVSLRLGTYPPEVAALRREGAELRPAVPDSGGFTPIFRAADRVYFWMIVPILGPAGRLGEIAHLRRVSGSGTAADLIEELIGPGTQVYYATPAGDLWVDLQGQPLPGRERQPPQGARRHRYADGREVLAVSSALADFPFVLVAEAPMETIMARPRSFLGHVILGALLLTLAGAVLAWLLSRRITRPLRELNQAARSIAHGEYHQRVDVARGDELGQLAAAFNVMAADVQAAVAAAEEARVGAEAANRAKSEFLATMSHEIRTPINAILGYTDLMQIGVSGPLTETQREQLERIRMSGRHLTGLVDEVLDLASIEAGRLRVTPEEADAGQALQAAAAVMRPEADRGNVALEVHLPARNALRYRGDIRRVQQVLINLLANAVKFTPTGGQVRVEASAAGSATGRWVEFHVYDNGPGIPATKAEEIFQPFVQGDSGLKRAHGGVGLGLAISRKLARLMEGEVELRNDREAGAHFVLRLPQAATPALTPADGGGGA